MPEHYWAPHVTVAAIIEHAGHFLMVEEYSPAGDLVLNQPAGHLDPGESLQHAVVREVREETSYDFCPEGLCGIYQWVNPLNQEAFLRFCFVGSALAIEPALELDEGILRACWMTHETLQKESSRLRSPLVLQCIEAYLGGHRVPMNLLHVG
jgi:ADP-ribose pyrophosphatase YjhB (NUDIX family)